MHPSVLRTLPAFLVPALAALLVATPARSGCDCPEAERPDDVCLVPGTHATIQDAVDDPDCVEIEVSPGTHAEHVKINDRSLTLRAASTGTRPVLQAVGGSPNDSTTIVIEDVDTVDANGSQNVCIRGLDVRQPALECDHGGFPILHAAIRLMNSRRCKIVDNEITGVVILAGSDHDAIYQNVFRTALDVCHQPSGVALYGSRQNQIHCNEFECPSAAILSENSTENSIFLNNFNVPGESSGFPVTDYTISTAHPDGLNVYHDGACRSGFWHVPCRGNFWAEYVAAGPPTDHDGDGVGDTDVPVDALDPFPLMAAVDIWHCTPNLPPTCVIEPVAPRSCGSSNLVTLDGCASSDADDGPSAGLAFLWDIDPDPGVPLDPDCQITVSLPAVGTYVATLSVFDGQDWCATTEQIVVFDAETPSVTCGPPPPIPVECTLLPPGGGGTLAADWAPTVADNCTPAGLLVVEAAEVVAGVPRTWTSLIPAGTKFPLGDTTVAWTVTDQAGNAATCTTIISVRDTVPPDVELCLQKQGCVTYLVSGGVFADLPIYRITSFSGTDACDPATTCEAFITQTPPPGGIFDCCDPPGHGIPSYIPNTTPDDGRYCLLPIEANDTIAVYNTCWPPPPPPPGGWPGLGRDDCGSGDSASQLACLGPQPTFSIGGPGLSVLVRCTDASGNVRELTWAFPRFCDTCEGGCCLASHQPPNCPALPEASLCVDAP